MSEIVSTIAVIIMIGSFLCMGTIVPATEDKNLLKILLPIFLISAAVMIVGAYFAEKKSFNKGICRKCGGKLEYFDSTSQG
jgi:hypothetical protein